MKVSLKSKYIILFIVFLLLLVGIFFIDYIRIIVALPFVLLLPGYLLTALLFPKVGDLKNLDRIVLSMGLSILIVPWVGLLQNYLLGGIRLLPMMLAITFLNLIFIWLGWYRRKRLPEDERFMLIPKVDLQKIGLPKIALRKIELPKIDLRKIELRKVKLPKIDLKKIGLRKVKLLKIDLRKIDLRKVKLPKIVLQKLKEKFFNKKLFNFIQIITGLILLVTMAHLLFFPKISDNFTEFYITGKDGAAAAYPEQLEVGEYGVVKAVIINHEHQKVTYTIEIKVDGELIQTINPISLEHLEKWENMVLFKVNKPNNAVKVDFLLFRDTQNLTPYRQLNLWVKVVSRGGGGK